MSVPRQRIRIRRATAAQWAAANPVLLDGELAVESDTHQLKVGDGATAWNSLAYTGGSSALNQLTDVSEIAKVEGSVLYYSAGAGKWKGDNIQTIVTLTDGGNF